MQAPLHALQVTWRIEERTWLYLIIKPTWRHWARISAPPLQSTVLDPAPVVIDENTALNEFRTVASAPFPIHRVLDTYRRE